MEGKEEEDFGTASKLGKTALRQITNCDKARQTLTRVT
jgi:hypothetical protein